MNEMNLLLASLRRVEIRIEPQTITDFLKWKNRLAEYNGGALPKGVLAPEPGKESALDVRKAAVILRVWKLNSEPIACEILPYCLLVTLLGESTHKNCLFRQESRNFVRSITAILCAGFCNGSVPWIALSWTGRWDLRPARVSAKARYSMVRANLLELQEVSASAQEDRGLAGEVVADECGARPMCGD